MTGFVELPGLFPAIAAVCPVQRVDIDFEWFAKASPAWRQMANSPALERVRWLECRRYGQPFGKAVLASPYLTSLHTLYLQWGWLEEWHYGC